jgi:hypothetical protein
MANIKFDGTLNIPTLITIFGGIVTALGVFFSVRGDVKTHTAQIAQMNVEIGELRNLAMNYRAAAAARADRQDKAVQEVAKVAEANKQDLVKSKAVIKKLPELVAAQVNK